LEIKFQDPLALTNLLTGDNERSKAGAIQLDRVDANMDQKFGSQRSRQRHRMALAVNPANNSIGFTFYCGDNCNLGGTVGQERFDLDDPIQRGKHS
jgi:hypothetical protein